MIMQTKKLRGAVIGCGFFAQNHLHGWLDLDDVELVAVCDLNEDKARTAAERYRVSRYYTGARTMFERERPDFVDIPTTMETHEELVGLAVDFHIPVIVQKPFAPDIDGCRRMVAKAAAAGVPLMVHEDFRFQKIFAETRREIDTGVIGNPVWGRFSWRTGIDVYANQPYLLTVERFIILDLGIHILDLARFIFGEVAEVTAHTQRIKPDIVGEDVATIVLKHVSGAVSVVDVSYASRRTPDPFPLTVSEIEGTRGTVTIGPDYRLSVQTPQGSRTREVPPDPRSWTSEPWHLIQDSVVHTERHFIDSLRAGAEPSTSGRDNLRTFALVEAAYASAAAGGRPIVPVHE